MLNVFFSDLLFPSTCFWDSSMLTCITIMHSFSFFIAGRIPLCEYKGPQGFSKIPWGQVCFQTAFFAWFYKANGIYI